MTKRLTCLLLIFLILCSGCGSPRYRKYQAEFSGLFDTITVVVGYARGEAEFNRYAEIIYERMKELNCLYDIYNEYEGMNNLYTINQNAGIAPVKVDREIIDLLLLAREGYDFTNGAVNVVMGSVFKIWHDYRTEGVLNEDMAELPPRDTLIEASRLCDINDLIIDEANSTVFLSKQGMSLDVGAVAKGYAAGLAAEAAKNAGMNSAVINAGGNIISIGMPLDNVRARWGIGVQDPDLSVNGVSNVIDTVYINDKTIVCSGSYQRYYVVDGQAYNHIIDPNTLMPANLYKEVAIIHSDSGTADLLSTALFIMPQEEGALLAERFNADALWIYTDGSQIATEGYVRISKNLGNYSAVDL